MRTALFRVITLHNNPEEHSSHQISCAPRIKMVWKGFIYQTQDFIVHLLLSLHLLPLYLLCVHMERMTALVSASTISTQYRSMEATSSIPSTFPQSFHFDFLMSSNTKQNYLVLGHPIGLLPLTFNSNVLLGILFPLRIWKLVSKLSINLSPF